MPMCLGIVGRVVALPRSHPDLADVEVAGIVRPINISILSEEKIEPGDWVLIHVGFAMQRIDEETARNQLDALADYVPPAPEWDDPEGG